MALHSYRDLDVWKLAVELAAAADALSEKLLRAHRFKMADQLFSAALSVSSNIAGGNGRVHRRDYGHHVSLSRGSLLEVESILCVAIRCRHLSEADCAHPSEHTKPASLRCASRPSPQSLVPSPRS